MYVVTFYSFKGGVGRTMALVNVATALAERGRRVLIVDFDLEAPGLATYPIFEGAHRQQGIVDYVTEYLNTSEAPDVGSFILDCQVGATTISVMSAGRRDNGYSARLSAINWPALYSEKAGFLMFEDLKQQWEEKGYDYVLIDSRTGHTDVGGICTRQLPDAVVLMFYPNDQNLSGLKIVVDDIREEMKSRARPIALHFCASNVPNIDDEEQILERKLALARKLSSYDEDPILIHHYESLSLLDQKIFIKDRPSSRLANEYRQLVSKITSRNIEDRDGALARLGAIHQELRRRGRPDSRSAITEVLDRITRLHQGDGEVAWEMSRIYSLFGDSNREAEALTVAIEQGYQALGARRRRAHISRIQSPEDALADLHVIMSSPDARGFEFLGAVDSLRGFDPGWVEKVSTSPSLQKLDQGEIAALVRMLQTDKRGLGLALELLISGLRQNKDDINLQVQVTLCLIASHRYEDAMRATGYDRETIVRSQNLIAVFNYAMADWGARGEPSNEIFRRAAELFKEDGEDHDVNWAQCNALTFFIVGENALAQDMLTKTYMLASQMRGTAFSCWRYLEVSRNEMLKDLDALTEFFKGGRGPRVFDASEALEPAL